MKEMNFKEVLQVLQRNCWPSTDDPQEPALLRRNILLFREGQHPPMLFFTRADARRAIVVITHTADDSYLVKVRSQERGRYWEFVVGHTPEDTIWTVTGSVQASGTKAFEKLQDLLASCEQINGGIGVTDDKVAT